MGGIFTETQHEAMVQQYLGLLDVMEAILKRQPFIMGERPTIADFGLAGPFFRHFSSDPTPRKIMQQRAPAVFEWVARLWNAKMEKLHPLHDNGSISDVGVPGE